MATDPKTPGQSFGKADREPTSDEEAAAERSAEDVDPAVAEHEKEMNERGANVKGEGQITPS